MTIAPEVKLAPLRSVIDTVVVLKPEEGVIPVTAGASAPAAAGVISSTKQKMIRQLRISFPGTVANIGVFFIHCFFLSDDNLWQCMDATHGDIRLSIPVSETRGKRLPKNQRGEPKAGSSS